MFVIDAGNDVAGIGGVTDASYALNVYRANGTAIRATNGTGNTSGTNAGVGLYVDVPSNRPTIFLGTNSSTASFGANDYSADIRFNGADVAWGDIAYYPQGNTAGGAFRFVRSGSTVSPTPNANIGVNGIFLAGGNTSSNLLDDYEEGTFTPAFQNVAAPTYTNQTGSYTKIGRLVHVYISISYSSLDTTDGSSLAINLPFTATASGAFHLVEASTNTGFAGSNTISLVGSVGAGSAAISFGSTGNYDDGDYDSGNWNASGVLRFVGVYPAD